MDWTTTASNPLLFLLVLPVATQLLLQLLLPKRALQIRGLHSFQNAQLSIIIIIIIIIIITASTCIYPEMTLIGPTFDQLFFVTGVRFHSPEPNNHKRSTNTSEEAQYLLL